MRVVMRYLHTLWFLIGLLLPSILLFLVRQTNRLIAFMDPCPVCRGWGWFADRNGVPAITRMTDRMREEGFHDED